MIMDQLPSEHSKRQIDRRLVIKILIFNACALMIVLSIYRAFLSIGEGEYMDGIYYTVHIVMYSVIIILVYVILNHSKKEV